jgi:hypothetical protein
MNNFSTVSFRSTVQAVPLALPKEQDAAASTFAHNGKTFQVRAKDGGIVIIDPTKPPSAGLVFSSDKRGTSLQDQRVAVETFRNQSAAITKDSSGTFVVSSGAINSAQTVEDKANRIAQGIRLNGGIGEYFAVGVDLPDLLTGGFSQALSLALKKLGVPPTAIAAAEKFIITLAAKGKSLGGPIGTVPRVEFNFSMLPDLKAQEASSNIHIKFSPVSYAKVQELIANYKVVLSAIPGGQIMTDLLTQLQQRIDRAGRLKFGTSPMLSAIYASLVAEATPAKPQAAKPGPIPSQTDPRIPKPGVRNNPGAPTTLAKLPFYTPGKLALFDTRISFNPMKALNGEDPNIRIGRMYVAVGNFERLNESISTNKLGKYLKILGAPYVSPRIGADGSVQVVFGFGGLAVASSEAPDLQNNKALLFPGIYVAAKLSFGANNTFVKLDDNTFALRMSINGSSVLVTVPPALFKTVQTMIVGNDRELVLSSMKPGEKILNINGIASEFLIKNIDPKILEMGSQIAQKSQEIAGIVSNTSTQEAATMLMGIMGFRAGPVVGTISTLGALAEVNKNKYEREFENFHDGLLKRLASSTSSTPLFSDISRTLQLLATARDERPFSMNDLKVRLATLGILATYKRSIDKAISEGKFPGGMLGFYRELKQVVKNSPAGSFDSIVAKLLLGEPYDRSVFKFKSGADYVASGVSPIFGKDIFQAFKQIEQMKGSGKRELSDAQILQLMDTKNPVAVREAVDYYIANGGNAQRLTSQLGGLWRKTVEQGKQSKELRDTYSSAISNPLPRAWVTLNNAIVTGDGASLRNQNKLFDFSQIEGFLKLKSPVEVANFMRGISDQAMSASSFRDEQIRKKNPAYAGQALETWIKAENGVEIPASVLKYWDSIAYALVVNLGVDANFGIPFLAKRISNLKNAINGKKHFPLSAELTKLLPEARTQLGGNWRQTSQYGEIMKEFNFR